MSEAQQLTPCPWLLAVLIARALGKPPLLLACPQSQSVADTLTLESGIELVDGTTMHMYLTVKVRAEGPRKPASDRLSASQQISFLDMLERDKAAMT